MLPVMLNIIDTILWEADVEIVWYHDLAEVSNFVVVLNSATNTLVYVKWCREVTRVARILRKW